LEDESRPQTRHDRDAGRGQAVTIGRLRPDPIFDWRFVALSHNTVRGAAGGAIPDRRAPGQRRLPRREV